jgi:PAS domain-containing protein
MIPHLSFLQLTFLVGAAVAVAALLGGAAYALHKSICQTLKPDDLKPPRVRVEDETAFTLATLQGVIIQLKREQKTAQEKLLATDLRAEENTRKFELIAREINQGLMIFDRQGFVTFANAHAREVLAADTRSRRRYAEVLQAVPKFVELVGGCLETGSETRDEKIEYQTGDEPTRLIEVSTLPIRDRTGTIEAVVCLVREASS